MNGFFMGNGFQSVVDQKDFKDPVFLGSWGVSDEDLFNKAHIQHLKHHQSGKPFFSLIFSSSNHAPFEFPDGRIELHDEKKRLNKMQSSMQTMQWVISSSKLRQVNIGKILYF
jgi:phosphoglycerol transferase MdoB-like AlkP superfamily enzyme